MLVVMSFLGQSHTSALKILHVAFQCTLYYVYSTESTGIHYHLLEPQWIHWTLLDSSMCYVF